MWTIVILLENSKTKVIETIGDDTEAVSKYKALVEIIKGSIKCIGKYVKF